MRLIVQCGTLFLVCLCGVFLSRLFPFPMPSSVASMLLLFALLLARAVRPESLKETTDFLLGNMAFFFIPSGVGILAYIDALRGDVLALAAVCAVSALLTFAATAFTVFLVVRLQRRMRKGKTS